MKQLLSALRWGWRALDVTRRALLNLLLLALLAALAWGWWQSSPPRLKERTALVLELKGAIVEQFAGSGRQGLLSVRGPPPAQLRLRDILRALDEAARDERISHVVLRVDELGPAGLSTLREVAAAIDRFKAAGKPVLAWAERYSQRGYYLAAHASEVALDPMGGIYIEGFGSWRNYYKDLLDRVGVQAHMLRVGRFKNAAEPFVTNGPSAETMLADKTLYDALWGLYAADVEQARKAPAGALAQGIADLPARFAAAGGDSAQLALKERLVDQLLTAEQWRQRLVERGISDDQGKSHRRISLRAYLSQLKAPPSSGAAIGVVVAEGLIVDGEAAAGRVGGHSTAALIRAAREDANVKALVLRVRSPGGSAFASEQVRRELELTRAAGKPVVVSMGDVAASGGYWIATAADEVIADAATITGSIGVTGLWPSVAQALGKVGVHTGGYGTTWMTGAWDPRRELDPRFGRMLQQSVDHVSADFIARVATARRSTPEKIDAVAQGRVWSGAQAHGHGLVDRLGRFDDALQAAATRAKLPATARIAYFERSPSLVDRLLAMAPKWAVDELAALLPAPVQLPPVIGHLAQQATQELGALGELVNADAPFAAVVHCWCGVQP